MWAGLRPTSMSSFILIHPTVWPQYTNVTDRQNRQTDNGLIAYGEPFYKRSPKNYHCKRQHIHCYNMSHYITLTSVVVKITVRQNKNCASLPLYVYRDVIAKCFTLQTVQSKHSLSFLHCHHFIIQAAKQCTGIRQST